MNAISAQWSRASHTDNMLVTMTHAHHPHHNENILSTMESLRINVNVPEDAVTASVTTVVYGAYISPQLPSSMVCANLTPQECHMTVKSVITRNSQ